MRRPRGHGRTPSAPRPSGEHLNASPSESLKTDQMPRPRARVGDVLVGIKRLPLANGLWKSRLLVDRASLRSYERRSLSMPGVQLRARDLTMPEIGVHVANERLLRVMSHLGFVDYIDPLYVDAALAISPSCSTPALLAVTDVGCRSVTTSGGLPGGS